MGRKQLEPAVQFGRYTLVAELGRGAMGAVYLATHGALHKSVALKVLHPHIAESPDIRERFKREGIAAATVDHPNVVNALDAGEHDGVPFLVMEYLEGQTLGALLQERRAAGRCLSPSEALDLLLPVMDGVAFAHEMGIVHRDLKPENIFLAELRNGRVEPKVLDFGIARVRTEVAEHTLTAEGSLLGTPAYMSPEQVEDTKRVDARSDLFSLAAVLYECVTGRRPIEVPPGATLQSTLNAIAAAVVTPPRVWNPRLPEAFAAVIMRGLARDREARYPSVRAMMGALRRAAAPPDRDSLAMDSPGLEPHAAPPAVAPPTLPMAPPGQTLAASPREIAAPPSPSPRGRALPVAVVALALVGVVGGSAALFLRAVPSAAPPPPPVNAALAAPSPAPPTRPFTAPTPSPTALTVAAPAEAPAEAPVQTAPPRDARPSPERRGPRATARRTRAERAPTPRPIPPSSAPPPRPVPMCGGVPCPD